MINFCVKRQHKHLLFIRWLQSIWSRPWIVVRRFIRLHRLFSLTSVLVLVFSLVLPLLNSYLNHRAYALSDPTKSLIGTVSSNLKSQLKYDSDKQIYQFNYQSRKADTAAAGSSGKPFDPASYNPFKHEVGGDAKNVTETYSFDLPSDLSKGSSLYDTNLGLSFQMIPRFKVATVKDSEGHLLYPFSNGQLIYSPKSNGLKEDIVLTRSHGDSVEYDYQLKLPEELEAKMMPDGGIGIYSVDPALFGNITFGTNGDQEKVMSARKKGPKTNLVFAIPPPTIKQALKQTVKVANVISGTKSSKGKPSVVYASSVAPDPAQAWFSLDGDIIRLKAKHLDGLSYPLSIDPSVVVNSTSGFALGNNEGSIDYPANQVNRGALTGATLSGGWTATTRFNTGRFYHASAVYNGYIYVLGGEHGTTEPACGTGAFNDICNDVQYALLCTGSNSGSGGCSTTVGTVGTWATTTNLPGNGFWNLAATAYNGYMYVTGGLDGATYQNTTEYAAINANGTLGTWITSPIKFNTGRYGHSTLVYNGYIYVMGGYSGSADLSDVQLARINTDGSIGAWASTTSFSVVRERASAVAYNGYIYIMGGYSSGTNENDVQYAPINANGTLGIWMTTRSFATPRYGQTTYIYNGYMYLAGGTGAAYYNDVQYAPINANGTLGTWTTTNAFTTARYGQTAVFSNGYLYLLGGKHSTSDTLCSAYTSIYCSDVQYAKVDGIGTNTSWSTGPNIAVALHGGCSVAYNGYIYSVGGVTAAVQSNYYSQVQYAALNADGTLGSWTAGTSFTQGVEGGTCVAYNGYLYQFGGEFKRAGSPGNPLNHYNTAQYSPLAFNGSNGAWTATTNLPYGTSYQRTFAYNGYMYLIGGYDGTTYRNDVYSVIINSNGTLGSTWAAQTALTTGRDRHQVVVNNNIVYVLGGHHGTSDTACNVSASLYCSDVQYNTLGANGAISTSWTSTTSMPAPRSEFAAEVNKNYLYIYGGWDGTSNYSSVQFTSLASSGALGSTWTTSTAMSTALRGIFDTSYNGYLYFLGGWDGATSQATSNISLINYGGPGTISTWSAAANTFTTARWTAATVILNGYLYLIAGYHATSDTACNPTANTDCSDVQFAKINANGTLSTWATTSSITNPRRGLGAFAYNGYVYMGGGSSSSYWNDIQYAKQNSDGTLAAWVATSSFNVGRDNLTMNVYNGYAYMSGGNHGTNDTACNTVSSPYCADVQYAPINLTNGTLGSWTATTSLPSGRNAHQTLIYNGNFYVLGGTAASNLNDVDVAPINSNGTLGIFTTTTPMINASYQFGALAYDGYIYIFGGHTSADQQYVQYAPIYSDGTIGQWTWTTLLIGPRSAMNMEVYNGYIYEIDGVSNGGAQGDVEISNDLVLPRVGNYSRVVDIGGTGGAVSTMVLTGSSKGDVDIKYALGCPATGIPFGSEVTLAPIEYFSSNTTTIGNPARYVYVNAILDDSFAGVFPDTGAGYINSITINYTTGAATAIDPHTRLYAGKFFKNQVLQPLDTSKVISGTGGSGGC